MYGHTGFAPAHGTCLSWSTLLRLQTALQGSCPKRARHFVHFPGLSHSGSQILHKCTGSAGHAFCALPRFEQLRCLVNTLPQVGGASHHLPGPRHSFPGCTVCLLWGADLSLRPSWQMSTIQDPRKTWLATGSLLTVWLRMLSLGPRLPLAFWLPLGLLPGRWEWVGGLVCSQLALLWYSLNPLSCELARLCLRLELFTGKFSHYFFFSPLSLSIPQFRLLSQVSSLRLSLGHSGLVLTLSMQTGPPCPAPACWWWSQVSRLLLRWELGLGAYSVGFFPSWLYRAQNSPPTHQ